MRVRSPRGLGTGEGKQRAWPSQGGDAGVESDAQDPQGEAVRLRAGGVWPQRPAGGEGAGPPSTDCVSCEMSE